jgi:hypothetical protein
MASAKHGAPEGAKQGQNRPNYQQKDSDNPQNGAMEQQPDDEQNNT